MQEIFFCGHEAQFTWLLGAPSPTNFHPQQIVKQY